MSTQQLWNGPRAMHERVDRLFRKYSQIDLSHIEPYNHKFRNSIAVPRLEIAFAGKSKGYKAPNYNVSKYEHSEGLQRQRKLCLTHAFLIHSSGHAWY